MLQSPTSSKDYYNIQLQLQGISTDSLWIAYNAEGTNPMDSIVEIGNEPTRMSLPIQRPGKINVFAIIFEPEIAVYKQLLDIM
jgi:hypothetical protein